MKGKKLLLIVFTGILLLTAACGAKVDYSDSPYTGVWECYEAEASGIVVAADNVFDAPPRFSFRADGKAVIYYGEDKGESKWEETDTGVVIKEAGGDTVLTADGDILVLEQASSDGDIVILRLKKVLDQ